MIGIGTTPLAEALAKIESLQHTIDEQNHDSFYNIDNPWVKHNSQCVTPLTTLPLIEE